MSVMQNIEMFILLRQLHHLQSNFAQQ